MAVPKIIEQKPIGETKYLGTSRTRRTSSHETVETFGSYLTRMMMAHLDGYKVPLVEFAVPASEQIIVREVVEELAKDRPGEIVEDLNHRRPVGIFIEGKERKDGIAGLFGRFNGELGPQKGVDQVFLRYVEPEE